MKPLIILIAMFCSCFSSVSAQKLKKNMRINISISGVSPSEVTRISKQYRINDEGLIDLPLLQNDIKASGKTVTAVEKAIKKAYQDAKIYTDPVITLTTFKDADAEAALAEARRAAIERARLAAEEAKVVYIGGKVAKPAEYRFRPGMTVADLYAKAGGPNTFGSKHRFTLTRNGKTTTYNYHKRKSDKFIRLRVGDHISIPAATFGRP